MKKTTIFLIFILSFSMILPVLQIAPIHAADSSDFGFVEESTTLAATPGSDVHVIRVSDDSFTIDDDPYSNFDDHNVATPGFDAGLYCGNDSSGYVGRIWMKFNLTHIPNNVQFTRATVNLYMMESDTSADEPT